MTRSRKRQPLAARTRGSLYRSWFWAPGASSKGKKLGKRRSARRERAAARREIRGEAS